MKGMGKQQSAVVYADIVGLKKEDILDLRVPQSFVGFIEFANKFLSIGHIQDRPGVSDEENLINRRSILISAYSKAIEAKLVIGFFEQRERERIADEIRMAKGYNMVVGIETIYCVKDSTILSNIKQ